MKKLVKKLATLVTVFILITLLLPHFAIHSNVAANSYPKKLFAKYSPDSSVDFSFGDVVKEEVVEFSIEVKGGKTTLVPYAPTNAFEWVDFGTQELDAVSENISPEQRLINGRYLLTYRFKVLEPSNAQIVFVNPKSETIKGSKLKFKSTSSSYTGESLMALELNAITPPPPRTGTRKPVVLLVDFSDRAGTSSVSFFQNLLFSKTSSKYSLRDYFYDVSYSLLDVNGTTYG